MTTLDDVRRFATALPEVQESTHFRFGQPIFKVAGKPFAGGGGSQGATTAVFSVSPQEAAAAVADDPATYEEVWRPGARKSLVGLRVDLANVSQERVQELVEHAWRNKAPNEWYPLTTPNDGSRAARRAAHSERLAEGDRARTDAWRTAPW